MGVVPDKGAKASADPGPITTGSAFTKSCGPSLL
jgi:hypothetical protein